MAIIKCKMCGGDLTLTEGQSVAECEYCGSRQTVPAADNEKKLILFARAGRLRAACDFDKAAGIYEAIVADFPEESEAYWGLVLCKYGIEYVDDPATGKKIPTCHRSSFDSVMDDGNFEQAMENADEVALRLYRQEAKQIEGIRKGILEVSNMEKPYDIFICYKETDSSGDRTVDSLLAQDIYDALTAKGYRVFFSRITLEDKLGQAYEPYIFAALNSAKIMLAVGTCYEHYNAVWVKNEWSRYLKIAAKDKNKYLIPCYKGLDAYDIPREFAHLQGQDMGKVGAMQDLLRGIEKLMPMQVQHTAPLIDAEFVPQPAAAPLLKRMFMFLEDGEWKNADVYSEKVLDIDPENAQAYLGKLMVALKIPTRQALKNLEKPFDDHKYYQKAIRYADKNLSKEMEGYLSCIKARVEEKRKIQEQQAAERWTFMERMKEESRKQLPAIRQELKPAKHLLALGDGFTVGLRENGTVVSVGSNKYGQCNVTGWTNIIAIDAGQLHTVGLKANGTVLAVGYNKYGQCDVLAWREIVAIAAGTSHTVGLKADGSVVAVGYNSNGRCNVDDWTDIASVSAGFGHTVGLKSNGTVVAVGENEHGQCNVTEWKDIIAVAAGFMHTVGLKADGTVVTTGRDTNRYRACDVADWWDIVDIAARNSNTVGLMAGGNVLAVGSHDDGECNVMHWKNIVAVYTGWRRTMGVKKDGTVVAEGWNGDGQCNVSGWRLFDKFENLEHMRTAAGYRSAGFCQHCGGSFKGLFGKKCVNCGKPKDY